MPILLPGGSPTMSEYEAILGWIKQDRWAKNSISITACEVWEILASHFNHSNISLQFSSKTQISNLKIIKATDTEKYITAHTLANK
ncbi:hypothetical protein PAXRUDRAFT_20242 [Paxillus rubicundulus Ve08.2h10]|uniref:Uncharacterized protein n=1 Tax=Paxillus rubicundulus Ve08.2h10 TaxID=930991 RepID=A0A0D0CSW8_9AGAM|nr:hypothetical protein PAXRUDRAFT_20242 [Paxillus rubicundulus Ve08.2h10]